MSPDAVQQVNLSRGLVGYWTFDDVDVDAQRGELRDRSGHGNDLELEGGVTTGVESPVGEAFSFDGTDDGVRDGDMETEMLEGITVAALVRCDDGLTVARGNDRRDGRFILHLSGSSMFYIEDSEGNNSGYAGGEIPDNTWQWYIGRWDGEMVDTWVDGDRKDSVQFTGSGEVGLRDLLIGIEFNDTYGQYDGSIGFFGIWDRSIAPREIQALNRQTARKTRWF